MQTRWLMTFIALLIGVIIITKAWVEQREQKEMPRYRELAAFSLTNSAGNLVTRNDLTGRVSVVNFFFRGCSGSCLTLSSRMQEIQRLTSAMPEVRLVSISVDPETDTPAALQNYARQLQADTNRWWFLTGSRKGINQLVCESFLLPVEGLEENTTERVMAHSDKICLVDAQGQVRGYFDGLERQTPREICRAVEVLRQKQR